MHPVATNKAKDALLPKDSLSVRLPAFEGPLDLLLYLIRRDEVDVYDIPIASITDQYIEILSGMETLDLEVAGEFFVMASTLMYIKSRLLLPKKDQGEDLQGEETDIDPRWELVQQLLTYQKFKEASESIRNLILKSNDLIPREAARSSSEQPERPLRAVDRMDLWNTFNTVLQRLAERMENVTIAADQVTIADQMEFILLKIKSSNSFSFSGLFDESTTLTKIVATFMALLELTRLGEINLKQDDSFGEIICHRMNG